MLEYISSSYKPGFRVLSNATFLISKEGKLTVRGACSGLSVNDKWNWNEVHLPRPVLDVQGNRDSTLVLTCDGKVHYYGGKIMHINVEIASIHCNKYLILLLSVNGDVYTNDGSLCNVRRVVQVTFAQHRPLLLDEEGNVWTSTSIDFPHFALLGGGITRITTGCGSSIFFITSTNTVRFLHFSRERKDIPHLIHNIVEWGCDLVTISANGELHYCDWSAFYNEDGHSSFTKLEGLRVKTLVTTNCCYIPCMVVTVEGDLYVSSVASITSLSLVHLDGKVVDLVYCATHCVITTDTGKVYGIGDNREGQLGPASILSSSYKFSLVLSL